MAKGWDGADEIMAKGWDGAGEIMAKGWGGAGDAYKLLGKSQNNAQK